MGINFLWQDDVFLTVKGLQAKTQLLNTQPYYLIDTNTGFFIHLISIDNSFEPQHLIELQQKFALENKRLIHLWEDVWLSKKMQVISRLKSFLSLNSSIHGRKTKVYAIEDQQAKLFLNSFHLQGYAKSAFHFGLFTDGVLMAVASFSKPIVMKQKGDAYQSAELVRFASKEGFTVVGGLSKLVKFFTKLTNVNDIMTYADRDWSLGIGYEQLNFSISQETEPLYFYLHCQSLKRYQSHRLPNEVLAAFNRQNATELDCFLTTNGFSKVFNTGNLKYHLYL